MQRELTAALVKAWVPQRKAFKLAGRLVPFSIYDVTMFSCLPVTGKIVEFGEDDLSTTELAKMSDNLKSEKGSKRPVFRNYIKVMKKLLDANKELEKLGLWLSLYAWRVMSGVILSRTPYGAVWSVQKYIEDVHGVSEYAWAEAVWRVLVEAVEEMQRKLEGPVSDLWFYEHTIRFAKHDKCRFPRLASRDSVDHGGRSDVFQMVEGIKESKVIPMWCPREEEMLVPTGVLSYGQRLERARKELHAEKKKHSHANELEARMKMCAAPGEAQDTGHQPRGDVGSNSALQSLARVVTDLGEAITMISVRLRVGKRLQPDRQQRTSRNMPSRIADIAAPPDYCDDVGDAPQCSEPHVQSSAEVEDIGERAVDTVAMPCGEVLISAQEPVREQQQQELVVGESGALLGPHIRKEAANTDAPGPSVDEVYVGGDSVAGEGVSTTLASSVVNVEDCTLGTTEGVDYEVAFDPGMQSVHHALLMAADSMAADDEACVEPLLGESVERVTAPEKDAQITGETKRTSLDTDDVGCEDDGGGKSSNIVIRIRRKLRCRKQAAVHGTPFTDPTRIPGARKSKKEMKEGMTDVDKPCAVGDPCEGSAHPSVLDMQPLSVAGSGIRPSVEELHKLKLTEQVLMNFGCMYLVFCVLQMRHS
ncbi:hypothetical protein Cgig2_032853 [Carnegiea gigantea]|uniref:Aminotransferase-like plant mobile domain-containing protein n=1 Tax=Carnegiea gigantea TaxID=171969 RepID=A0A9Q1GZ49_9CARY|nr:hypothetical protein Cgig2_032853 [Carnegiea gigantea]